MWNDQNDNGAHDTGEPGLAGWTVYEDLKKDGKLDAGDPTAITQTDGSYSLPNLAREPTLSASKPRLAGWKRPPPSAT